MAIRDIVSGAEDRIRDIFHASVDSKLLGLQDKIISCTNKLAGQLDLENQQMGEKLNWLEHESPLDTSDPDLRVADPAYRDYSIVQHAYDESLMHEQLLAAKTKSLDTLTAYRE